MGGVRPHVPRLLSITEDVERGAELSFFGFRQTDGRTDAINVFWVFLVKYYSKFGITLIDGLQQRISEFYYQENHSLAYIVDVKQEKNTFCGRTDIILLK